MPARLGESALAKVLGQLSAVPVSSDKQGSSWRTVRAALAALRLSPGLLLVLAGSDGAKACEAGALYIRAMGGYQ